MNKYEPHVYVLPEDDRDRQIAEGFVQHVRVNDLRIQVMRVAGGWRNVMSIFVNEYIPRLRNYPNGHVILVFDFDGEGEKRATLFQEHIPKEVAERVFLLGPRHTPETLKSRLNKRSYEQIGEALAEDCAENSQSHWSHPELDHNESDRLRLNQVVRPFLIHNGNI